MSSSEPSHPSHDSRAFSGKTVFGKSTADRCDEGNHVEDLWRDRKEDDYHQVLTSLNESTYKKNPLGRSCNQGHSLPTFMLSDDYRHGVKTFESSKEDAKHLIYPLTNNNELNPSDNCVNNRGPGQQRRRNYVWPIDPSSTTFGIKGESKGGNSGVKAALQMHNDNDNDICKHKNFSHDIDRVFGKSTCQGKDSAAECIRQTGSNGFESTDSFHRELDDLGKSLTPGFRNEETERIFGCPSIRSDIPKYEKSSVADLQNYGDDANAAYLLRPTLFSSLGLDDDEFQKPRSKEFLKQLFLNCGILNTDCNEFESVFSQVSDENNCASIEDFRCLYSKRVVIN